MTKTEQEFDGVLRAHLPAEVFHDISPNYLEEPRGRYQGRAGWVLRPANTSQVADILRLANRYRVPVVPYGGGTGLVGGQVMTDGPKPVLLSLERMRTIRSVDPIENVVTVEAGAILADIHSAVAEVNRLFPLSIAAKGSARIGGILATNAGGVNVLRYGNARDLCLGLEVVFADGQVWQGLSRLRKDNTGYDLRNLLIGSEGSLGVITAATLKLVPQPAQSATAMMVISDPSAALALLARAREHLGEAISAFELISGQGYRFIDEAKIALRCPFAQVPEWSVLIDIGVARGLDPILALGEIFQEAAEAGEVSDGVIAQSAKQRQEFWEIRERIPEANRKIGSISSHDISLPLRELPRFIEIASARLAKLGPLRINCFGHVGDGNLHFNLFPPVHRASSEYHSLRPEIKKTVHDTVHELSGSISAEHGIGRLRVEDLAHYSDAVKLSKIYDLKNLFDPNRILNPGVIVKVDS